MNEDNLMHIGLRIANLRRSHNYTQEALAEMLDISTKHMSHVERGCASLSLSKLIQVSHILDASIDYILTGTSTDKTLSFLPDTIIEILHSDNQKEISRLKRYLEIYAELYDQSKK